MKYDGVDGDRNNEQTADLALLFGVDGSDLCWVAGSTQAPEEQIVLDIYRRLKAAVSAAAARSRAAAEGSLR